MAEATFPAVSQKRRVGFFIVVGLFALLLIVFSGIMVPILPMVIVGWFNEELFGIHTLHEMVNSAFSWVILAGALLQFYHPERQVAALQTAILLLLVSAVVGLIAGTFFPATVVFLAIPVVAALLHPRRGEMLRVRRLRNPELLVLVVLASVPLLIYAANQLGLQQNAAVGDDHREFGHYASTASVAVSVIAVGVLASLGTTGWRMPAWAAGFLAIMLGLTSVVYPAQASSMGVLWGSVAIAWGLVFIGVAEWKWRKTRAG